VGIFFLKTLFFFNNTQVSCIH